MNSWDECEVVVVGAGHAGCEAAYASSRMGLETCLKAQAMYNTIISITSAIAQREFFFNS